MRSNGVNILSKTIALSAMEHIAGYLSRTVADGSDLGARKNIDLPHGCKPHFKGQCFRIIAEALAFCRGLFSVEPVKYMT